MFFTRSLLIAVAFVAVVCDVARAGVIEQGATLNKLTESLQFGEGPAADGEGNVYFTDQPTNRILRWGANDQLMIFMQPSGRANGLCFDAQGNLWACADEKNEIWRIASNKEHAVVLASFKKKLLNGPNDLWLAPNGDVYFTDPYFKRDYWTRGGMAQPCEGVYLLKKDSDTAQLISKDLVKPNGIIGTPDGKSLYVSDNKAEKTLRFAIQQDGTLAEKKIFCNRGSDGMTIDDAGNVYLTGKGVTVFNAAGEQVDHIDVNEPWTSNVCFGGSDRRWLFITASKCLYRIRTTTKGVGSS